MTFELLSRWKSYRIHERKLFYQFCFANTITIDSPHFSHYILGFMHTSICPSINAPMEINTTSTKISCIVSLLSGISWSPPLLSCIPPATLLLDVSYTDIINISYSDFNELKTQYFGILEFLTLF